MHLRLFVSPPRRRIRIGAATDGNQRHRTGMIGFEHVRCEASPVAADLIELTGFGGAVTRIICEHGDQFSLSVMSRQHGDSCVRRAIGNFAKVGPFAVCDQSSVHRKTGFAEA